ncbi:MAG: nucleotidyltransferase domain-containing protein [Rhizomicrobium sp.]
MSMDAKTDMLARQVKSALEHRFDDRLAAVSVFGNRAREEHRADSNFDIAVVLNDARRTLASLSAWASRAETMPVCAIGDDSRERRRLAAIVQREGVIL